MTRKLRSEMRTELRLLQKELGATFIYVTHDQLEALTMADLVAVMNKGVLQDAAPPKEIYGSPATRFVAEFVGSPAMSILPGTLDRRSDREGIARVGPWETSVELTPGDNQCSIGIRPEDLEIREASAGLSGIVKTVELLGADQQIVVETPLGLVLVRTDRRLSVLAGSQVAVGLVGDGLHVFGEPSGKRMRSIKTQKSEAPNSVAHSQQEVSDGLRTGGNWG